LNAVMDITHLQLAFLFCHIAMKTALVRATIIRDAAAGTEITKTRKRPLELLLPALLRTPTLTIEQLVEGRKLENQHKASC